MHARMDGHCRYGAAMRRCRAIERHAASLRRELECLAGGEGDRRRVDRALLALREQVERAGKLADHLDDAPLTIERAPLAA